MPEVTAQFTKLQGSELRVDIVRMTWLHKMADTKRLLEAFEAAVGGAARVRKRLTPATSSTQVGVKEP